MPPKISVIMPIYNGEKFLTQAITSVCQQSFRDWELVVVNDGSIDQTEQMVRAYPDPRILLITQENAGEGAARNAALEHARGEYLAFLDADDWFHPAALESNLRYLDQHPDVQVVYSDGYYCDENGHPLQRFSETRSKAYQGAVLGELAISPFTCGTCSVMIRKSVVDERKVRYDPALPIGTDWDFLLELARYFQFGYNQDNTCSYRLHQGNVTYTQQQKRSESIGKIRMRVLDLPEFDQLPAHNRYALLYQILLDSLKDDFSAQQSLLEGRQVSGLPGNLRARLLRLSAAGWVENPAVPSAAIQSTLEQSLKLNPADRITRISLFLAHRSRAFLAKLVAVRRYFSGRQRKNLTSRVFDLASLDGN